jgi:hypothetical protein
MNSSRHLWTLSAAISATIERWLQEHEHKRIYVRFKKIDLLRLTRLQVWSWRHKVSIEEILSLTLPYLRKSLSTNQKARYGLGCSIASLTGIGNEKILIEAIHQKYPGGEHRDVWRDQERRRQLEVERQEEMDGLPVREKVVKGMFDCDSIPVFLQSYRARVVGTRRKLAAEASDSKRKRKHYRGNPWT